MKYSARILACLGALALTPALFAAEFRADTAPFLQGMPVKKKTPKNFGRVSGDAFWRRLLNHALTDPSPREVELNGTTYKIYTLSTNTPLEGQNCPSDTQPENSISVTTRVAGSGNEIYPVRLSAACVGLAGKVRDSFSVDADADGDILNASLSNGSLGINVQPMTPSSVPQNDSLNVSSLIFRLVALLEKVPVK